MKKRHIRVAMARRKMLPDPNQTSSARIFDIDGWIVVMMVIVMV